MGMGGIQERDGKGEVMCKLDGAKGGNLVVVSLRLERYGHHRRLNHVHFSDLCS